MNLEYYEVCGYFGKSSTGGDFLDEFLGDGPFFGGEGDGDEGEALG